MRPRSAPPIREESRRFLDTVDASTLPELELHLILDHEATHDTAPIQRWVLERSHVHFTPTSASRTNLVESRLSRAQTSPAARERARVLGV